jgi:hypothetical protein
MAASAQRLSALPGRLVLPPALARRRNASAGACGASQQGAQESGQEAHADRHHPGQAKRQDDGKKGPRGDDAGKRINGRKRHLLVDTPGLVWKRQVLPANVQDPEGARQMLPGLRRLCPRLQKMWADGIYGGWLIDRVAAKLKCVLETV